ncbi:hypothetical protein fugu_009178 [Takifugu bimaculatus]|uniref:Neurotransmitter-gated ion-channel transmembrane domain-containing protein n=1 Tax=Takifugu bimaculatus TaxID=433685 RepID=A0A4Z2B296_9TELE|nr:hypothetical protein fugu_009178 [Takifugu bimaculatus]
MAAPGLGMFYGFVLFLGTLISEVQSNEETELIKDLFKGYNKNIRPVVHPEDKVEVQIKLTLTNLISLNEKEETLTTNVWIEIQWLDHRLSWNESKYYGIQIIRVPCKTVWLPDIVLENKYLIFVMCVTTLIATNQIVVLNFSLRSPNTHTMSQTIKHVFLEMVPRFLCMPPLVDESEATTEVNGIRERRRSSFGLMQRAEEYVLKQPRSEMMFDKQRERHGLTRSIVDNIDVTSTANLYKSLAQAAPEIKQCVDACNFIADSKRQQNTIGSEIESWVLIGKMIDKVCFWAAILLFIIGTVAIFLMGHFNRAPDFPFPGQNKKYVPSSTETF